MSDTMINETSFIEMVSTYGGKPENWPLESRAAMQDYCRDNPQAEALLGREKSLDGWLDAMLPEADKALQARIEADMRAALAPEVGAHANHTFIAIPQADPSRRFVASAVTALAACFVGGFIAAPIALDMLTGGADLLASLDIISDAFLPTEPL